jgi:hypothetical protein
MALWEEKRPLAAEAPFDELMTFTGELRFREGDGGVEVLLATVRVNRVLGGEIPIEVVIPRSALDGPGLVGIEATVTGTDRDNKRFRCDRVVLVQAMGDSEVDRARATGFVAEFTVEHGNGRTPASLVRCHVSGHLGAWQYGVGFILAGLGDQVDGRKRYGDSPTSVDVEGFDLRLGAFVAEHRQALGTLAVDVAYLTVEDRTIQVTECDSHLLSFEQAARHFMLPASFATRRATGLIEVGYLADGPDEAGQNGVKHVMRFLSSPRVGRPGRSERPLVYRGALGDFVGRSWRLLADWGTEFGLGRAIELMCRFHEEEDFHIKMAFLFIALETTVNGLARRFGWNTIQVSEDVETALGGFREQLRALEAESGAAELLEKLNGLRGASFRRMFSRLLEHFAVRTDDVGGSVLDAVGLRNRLFHGRALEITPAVVFDTLRLACALERLLLRAVGWNEADRSDVDGDGLTVQTLRLFMRAAKARTAGTSTPE